MAEPPTRFSPDSSAVHTGVQPRRAEGILARCWVNQSLRWLRGEQSRRAFLKGRPISLREARLDLEL